MTDQPQPGEEKRDDLPPPPPEPEHTDGGEPANQMPENPQIPQASAPSAEGNGPSAPSAEFAGPGVPSAASVPSAPAPTGGQFMPPAGQPPMGPPSGGQPPMGQPPSAQPAPGYPQQYASGPVAPMPPAKEVSPGTANAFKLGAIVGATLFGTVLAIAIVLTLVTVVVADSPKGVNDPGIFTVIGLITNLTFGGHISFSSALKFLPSGSGGLFLITFALIAAAVAVIVGNKIWKTSPLEKAQEVWISIATIFGVSYILTTVFTLLSATTLPEAGQVSGSYGLPFFWLAIFSVAVGLIIASMNGQHITMVQKIASFRRFWAPGLLTAVLSSVVALVFLLIGGLIAFGLPDIKAVIGIFLFIVNALLAAIPLLFGTKVELGALQSSSMWAESEGLTILFLIIGVIITLIAGSVFRQRLRGYDTNPVYIASDAGVFAVLGIFAVAAVSLGNSENIHLGLAYSAILINAVVGAVISAIHVYLFPLIRGSAPALARAMQNYTQRPLPRLLTPFVHYGATPQMAYGQGFAPQGIAGTPGQFSQPAGTGQVPPPGTAYPPAGTAPSAASAPGVPVGPHESAAQSEPTPAGDSDSQHDGAMATGESSMSADTASAASAAVPAATPPATQTNQLPPAQMQPGTQPGMQPGYSPQQYAGMAPPAAPVTQRSPEEEAKAKARNRKIAAIAAAVVGAFVIALVVIKIVNSMMFGPQSTVDEYWSALENGRAGTAQSMEKRSETSPLMSDEVYGAAENRPTNITSVQVNDEPGYTDAGEQVDQRVFTVKYDLGGVTYSTDTVVQHAGKKYGFFDQWFIVGSQAGTLRVSSVQPVTVNGSVQVQPEGYLVYPGTYTISDSEDNPYLTLTSEPGTVPVGEDVHIEAKTELTEKAQQLAYDAVEELLNECNNATDGDGVNPCGLSMWVFPSDQYEFSWSVPTEVAPLSFSEGYEAEWTFTSDSPYEAVGTATPKADADPDYDLEVETEKDTFSVRGIINFADPANPIVEVEGTSW
ncbi:MAG: hypothetical protein Q4P05_00400 [Actinomycetaceae bacterium]|nr:hypothetical protein [Actinomycetaceae bacterium]